MTQKCSGAQLGGKLRHTGENEAHDKTTIDLTSKLNWCQMYVTNNVTLPYS